MVELIFRANNRSAIRALNEVGVAADRTATRVSRANESMSTRMRKVGTGATAMGRMMVGAAVPLAALGYVSAKSAMNFQASMEQIRTQAGKSQAEVDSTSKAVLNMSRTMSVAQGPNDLARGLFHLESIGLTQARGGMKALKVAADAAALGGSNLETTATALGSAWLVNIKGAGSLQHTMGLLNATVGAGNMRMDDLVQALGTGFLPAAKNAGLGIKDAMGALAVFTDEGYAASSAAAQMSTALHYLYEPTGKAKKALAGMGMTSAQMAADLHQPNGLLVALRDLRSHLQQLPGGATGVASEQVLGNILPGGRGRIILTLMNQLDRYQMKLGQISHTSGKFGEDVAAYHRTASFKIHAAWSSIQSSLTQFGLSILPIITKILPKFVHLVQSVVGWFQHLSKGTKEFLVKLTLFLGVGGAALLIFGKMIVFIAAVRDAFIALKIAEIGAASAMKATIVGLIIFALIMLVLHFKEVKKVAIDVFHWIQRAANDVWDWIKQHWPFLAGILLAPFTGGISLIVAAFHKQLIGPIRAVADTIEHIFKTLWDNLTGGVRKFIAAVKGDIAALKALFEGHPGAAARQLAGVLPQPSLSALTPWTHAQRGRPLKPGKPSLSDIMTKMATGDLGGAVLALGHTFGLMQSGGVVRPHYVPIRPNAQDRIPGYLQTGEGVVSRRGMSRIGESGLSAINSGGGGASLVIQPMPVYLTVDGRVLAQAVTKFTIDRAARGPTSLVGGPIVTGATGQIDFVGGAH